MNTRNKGYFLGLVIGGIIAFFIGVVGTMLAHGADLPWVVEVDTVEYTTHVWWSKKIVKCNPDHKDACQDFVDAMNEAHERRAEWNVGFSTPTICPCFVPEPSRKPHCDAGCVQIGQGCECPN